MKLFSYTAILQESLEQLGLSQPSKFKEPEDAMILPVVVVILLGLLRTSFEPRSRRRESNEPWDLLQVLPPKALDAKIEVLCTNIGAIVHCKQIFNQDLLLKIRSFLKQTHYAFHPLRLQSSPRPHALWYSAHLLPKMSFSARVILGIGPDDL